MYTATPAETRNQHQAERLRRIEMTQDNVTMEGNDGSPRPAERAVDVTLPFESVPGDRESNSSAAEERESAHRSPHSATGTSLRLQDAQLVGSLQKHEKATRRPLVCSSDMNELTFL